MHIQEAFYGTKIDQPLACLLGSIHPMLGMRQHELRKVLSGI